jgi:hypothetical protein
MRIQRLSSLHIISQALPPGQSQILHLVTVQASLAKASTRFLSTFSSGVSTHLETSAFFSRLLGSPSRSNDVVERAVDVERMEAAFFSAGFFRPDWYVLSVFHMFKATADRNNSDVEH